MEDDDERIHVVNDSDTASLRCDASGLPAPAVTWIQDGKKLLTSAGRFHIRHSGTLVISNVQVRAVCRQKKFRRGFAEMRSRRRRCRDAEGIEG